MLGSLFKKKAKIPPLQQLRFRPSIWMQAEFLSDAECHHLIKLARPRMKPATVLNPDTGKQEAMTVRTSSVCFLALQSDPVVASIESRLAALLQMPVENGEDLQLLHYEVGQHYVPHYDFFNPNVVGRARELAKGGQRVVTVLMYLTDVKAGGETVFPKIGLDVQPEKGAALIFYNMDQDGQVDLETWHGSLPVLAGEKWVATKWMRERPFIVNPE